MYAGQRRFAQAEELLERVVAASARARSSDDVETLRFRFDLGAIYFADGKPDKAEAHAIGAADGRRRSLGPDHRDTIRALTIVSVVHESRKNFAQALRAATQAYEQARRALGANDVLTLNASAILQRVKLAASTTSPDRAARAAFLESAARTIDSAKATSLPELISLAASRATIAVNQGRPQEAEAALVEALEAAGRAGQEELNLTAILAGVYALQKKYDEAEATAARVLGKPESWKTLNPNVVPFAVRSLGASYRNDGRFADAERHFHTLVPLVLDNPGDAAPQTRIDLLLLADTYSSLGRYADADVWFTRLLEAIRRASGPDQLTLVTTTALGWVRLQQERYADAERTLREVSETLVRTAPESWERFNVASMLGASLAGQQRFAEAEPLLISGYEGMATRRPASNPNFRSRFTQRDAGAAILQLFSAAGNAAKRAEWVGRIDGATRKD